MAAVAALKGGALRAPRATRTSKGRAASKPAPPVGAVPTAGGKDATEAVAATPEVPAAGRKLAFAKLKAPLAAAVVLVLTQSAAPAVAAAAAFSAADTCWMLVSTALVLFMTIPGLSAFYGGIVKRKNTLSVLMQCFTMTCLFSVIWFACGYSLSFSDQGNAFIGGLDKSFLAGVTKESLWETIPEALWALYQMTFAIITPALMVGSFVERMKTNAVLWYSTMWLFLVYFPACHMVWGPGGWLAAQGVLDFAGGIVVHITAGVGALVGAAVLGPRKDNRMIAGNLILTVLGTGMLWVGWFGFNGGSALAAGADAAFANLATQLAASTAALTWLAQDVAETGKASMLGIATGSIAGLATVTPCAGFVGPAGAVFLGLAAGVVCRFFSTTVKEKLGYDDSLDVFGVHGVGGFLGTCLLGVAAGPALGGFGETSVMSQTVIQCAAAVGCALYTAVVSFALLKVTSVITGGLRVPDDAEAGAGLDQYSYGETSYTLTEDDPDYRALA